MEGRAVHGGLTGRRPSTLTPSMQRSAACTAGTPGRVNPAEGGLALGNVMVSIHLGSLYSPVSQTPV